MNVQLEPKPNCVVNLHFELPPEEVSPLKAEVAKEFALHARVPGFRPGKAPRSVIESRFAENIRQEVEKRAVSQSIREAVKQHNLRLLRVEDVNHVHACDEHGMTFTASVITSPEFELPDYSHIEIELNEPQIGEADVDRVIENLREQQAEFPDVTDRELAWGDFAVIDYTGTVAGQPAEEILPEMPKLLRSGRNFWLRMDEQTFLPGFCEALIGAKPDEARQVDVTIPTTHPIESLRGTAVHYEVTLVAMKSRVLPEVDDEFAQRRHVGGNLEELRAQILAGLTENAKREFEARKREGAVRRLLESVQCELPQQMLRSEIDSVLRDIVSENQARGIAEDEIRAHESELIGAAQLSARERLRSTFLLLRIAEKEGVKVTEQDLIGRIQAMAHRYEMPFDKMVRDLRKRDAIPMLQEQILCAKALDLIVAGVTVRPKPDADPSLPVSAEG